MFINIRVPLKRTINYYIQKINLSEKCIAFIIYMKLDTSLSQIHA